MKRTNRPASSGQPNQSKQAKQRKYFNPYDDYHVDEDGSDYTYIRNRTSSRPLSRRTDTSDLRKKRKSTTTSRSLQKSGASKKVTPLTAASSRKTAEKKRDFQTGRRHIEAAPQRAKPAPRKPQLTKSRKLTNRQKHRLKKRRQQAFAFRVAIAMLMTVGIVWGGVYLKDYLTKTTISTQLVQLGSIDTSTNLEGVVLRKEKVVNSDQSGNAQYVVAEGEKVKKDGMVYAIVDEEKMNSAASQIEDVEKQIYNKAENSESTATNQDERYNLDQEVKNKFEEYYNNCYENSTRYVYALRSQLDSSVSNRTNLYMAQQKNKDENLVTQKLQLDKALGNYKAGKAVDSSGVISFHMDSYETEDIAAALKEMNYDRFNKLKKVTTSTQLGQSTVEKDSPVYKLILDNSWYIVTYINAKDDTYVQGSIYKLYFENLGDKPVSFSLIEKKEENSKVGLIFKTSNQIGDFLSVRGVSFSIGDKSVKGLKIPIQSIVEQNYIKIPMSFTVTDKETTGVYRQRGEVTEFVALDIQKTDKENQCYFVLQDLTDAGKIKLNDVLVSQENGSTYQVTESEVKQGVYVVNGKIASFKSIEIIDHNKDYAIVRNNNNSQLKEMDKIISNPKSVKMDELLDHMKIQNE